MTRLRPATSVPSASAHAVRGGVDDLAAPGDHGDLAALQQRLEALGEPVDDLLLARLGAAEVERRHRRASMPNSDARWTVRSTSAVWRSSLAGMQPRWRHVPPTRSSSTSAMFEPGGRAVQRGRVAGRASAEDHDVEFLGQNGHLLRAS